MAATIAPAQWPRDHAAVLALMRAYVDTLGVDIGFQDIAGELAMLPGRYAPPAGNVLLARIDAGPVGVVAWRSTDADTAEMKRLYVRPEARRAGLARRLAVAVIADARRAGRRRMVLDTLASMQAAQRLYASLGFTPIAPYYDSPLPGTAYLGRDL